MRSFPFSFFSPFSFFFSFVSFQRKCCKTIGATSRHTSDSTGRRWAVYFVLLGLNLLKRSVKASRHHSFCTFPHAWCVVGNPRFTLQTNKHTWRCRCFRIGYCTFQLIIGSVFEHGCVFLLLRRAWMWPVEEALETSWNLNQYSTHQQLQEPRSKAHSPQPYFLESINVTDRCDHWETGRHYARRTRGTHAICVIFLLNWMSHVV